MKQIQAIPSSSMYEKNSDSSSNMNSSLFASPNKSAILNKSGEEVQVRKKASNMAIPI